MGSSWSVVWTPDVFFRVPQKSYRFGTTFLRVNYPILFKHRKSKLSLESRTRYARAKDQSFMLNLVHTLFKTKQIKTFTGIDGYMKKL